MVNSEIAITPDGSNNSLFTIDCLPVVYFSLLVLLLINSNLKIIELIRNITITNVNAVHFGKHSQSAPQVAHLFISRTEFILQGLVFFRSASGSLEAFLEPKHRRSRHTLLHKAMAQHSTALKISRMPVCGQGKNGGCLKFADGLIEKAHLF